MIPHWFTVFSFVSLWIAILSTTVILVDIARGRRQRMWIMNVVWPVTGLFGSVLALAAYVRYGRKDSGPRPRGAGPTPLPEAVGKGAAHCGAGCTLGDLLAETLLATFPGLAVWFGMGSIFPSSPAGRMFAGWVLDFLVAFAFGIAFQYFAIQPMRNLPPWEGLKAALKADALSLTAWQVGMYGLMALAQFFLFGPRWGGFVEPKQPEFWFTMQLAMVAGFVTAYPVNWWLIRAGVKERM